MGRRSIFADVVENNIIEKRRIDDKIYTSECVQGRDSMSLFFYFRQSHNMNYRYKIYAFFYDKEQDIDYNYINRELIVWIIYKLIFGGISVSVSDISFSIITPVLNGEKTISRTIESVINQSVLPIEYFIIDGGSKDKTVEIAESYMERFRNRNIKYFVVSENDDGMYDALNKGIKLANGRFIGSINADDWYENNALEEVLHKYEEERFDIVWSDLRIIGLKNPLIKKAKVGRLWTTMHFCHPSMFCKREVLIEIPYINMNMDDDFDFILRANKKGVKITVINKILANYSYGGMSTKLGCGEMRKRIKMKYKTYIRNGYSSFYWFYCVGIEIIKSIMH